MSSPSKVTEEIGGWVSLGVAGGMLGTLGTVTAAAHDVATAAVPHPVYTGAGGRAGSQRIEITGTLDVPIVVRLNGKELFRATQTVALQHAARNLSTGLKLPNRSA